MALYGGVELVGRPDLENVRRLDLLPLPQIARMERVGIGIDLDYLAGVGSDFDSLMSKYQRDISNYIPQEALDQFVSGDLDEDGESSIEINANSAPQIRQLLFSLLNISSEGLKQTDAGLVSTGKKNLEMRRSDHEVVPLVLAYREVSKLKSFCKSLPKFAKFHNQGECLVCERHHAYAHHRLHGQILTTRAETGRLSMKKPNLQQIPKRSKLGRRIRAAFIAPPGRRLVSVDFSQMELRDLAHLANAASMIQVYWDNQDIHTFTACRAFGLNMAHYTDLSMREQSLQGAEKEDWAEFSQNKRLPSKNLNFMICLEANQKVLTDRGYVPIYKVTPDMLLWDGLEYVKHDGIVFKGYQEVVTYQGVTATPNHKVWTRSGSLVPISAALAEGLDLADGAIEGSPVRYAADNFWPNTDEGWRSDRTCEMRRMQESVECDRVQSLERAYAGLLLSAGVSLSKSATIKLPSETLRRNQAALQQSEERILGKLRWARNRVQVPDMRRVRAVCSGELAASHIQQTGYWPEGQRRSLRTREFAAGGARVQSTKYTPECMDRLQRRTDYRCRSVSPIETGLSELWAGPKAHSEISGRGSVLGGYSAPNSTGKVQIAPVYDILNAGPRRRFTVEGKLVSNCYGASWKGLQAQLALSGIYWDEATCKDFIARWFGLYPEVNDYLNTQEYRARRYGCVWTPCGRIRLVPEIRSCHPYKRSEGVRQAGNMPVQGANAEQTKLVMGELEEEYEHMRAVGIDVEALLPIHDEIISETDEEQAEVIGDSIIAPIFRNVMVDKQTGENLWRVPINADAKVSERWARVA